MYIFGSGALIITPQGLNQTPVNIGLVQDVTFDETTQLKELFGQNNRALAIGAGEIKATGKAKVARISGLAMASLFGYARTTGQTATAFGEAATVPAAAAFTVTVANSATWTGDLGLIYAATGYPLSRVGTAPTVAGTYQVAAGVYTLFSGDANAKLLASYNYTVAATGQSLAITSKLIGPTVNFSLNLYGQDPTNGAGYSLQLYNCVSSKLMFATKLSDFVIPEFDFMYYANAANAVGQWNLPDSH